MLAIPDNGRTLKQGDPLRDAILAKQREHKRRGEPYPCRTVDDFYSVPFVWLGRVPYRADSMERLVLTQEARKRPVPLPDHFIIDGDKRLPGENDSQYAKFFAYRDLGPERSLNKLAKSLGRKEYKNRAGKPAANSGYYSALASRFRWAERVAAWDGQIEIEAHRTQQAIMQDQMREEVERRKTYLDHEWETVQEGVQRIKEMLAMPVDHPREMKNKDGTITTIIEPARWTYASLSQFIGEVTKLARLHLGMTTNNALRKIESTLHDSHQEKPQMSPDEQAAHEYASRKAEESYFQALQEWPDRHQQSERVIAKIEA